MSQALRRPLAPLAEQASSLLAEIAEHPEDDAPRLILADWLEEHGDPRSELIRIQVEKARTPSGSLSCCELEDRERDWLDRYHGIWPPAGLDGEEVSWERGLLVVRLPAQRLLLAEEEGVVSNGLRLALGQGWIDHLHVTVDSAKEAEQLARLDPPIAGKVQAVRLSSQAEETALAHVRRLGRLRLLDLDSIECPEGGLRPLEGWADLAGLLLPTGAMTDEGLEPLRSLIGLRRLAVYDASITDAGLACLAGLTRLEELELCSLAGIDGSGLRSLAGLTRLRRLDLWNSPVRAENLEHLKAFVALEDLALQYGKVGAEGLSWIAGLTGLRKLNLEDASDVPSSGLKHLEKLARLRWLRLSRTGVTDEGLAHLAALESLEYLDLKSASITDDGLGALRRFPALRRLNLPFTKVTDKGLAHLAGLDRLIALDLFDAPITDAGLRHLGGLTGLRELDLESTPIGDAGLANLRGLTSLRELTLSQTGVKGSGLAHLAGMDRLHTLRLNTPRARAGDVFPHLRPLTGLRWLELCYIPATDADLEHLAGLTQLELLHLSDESRLTDAGLKHLHGLTRLRILSLGGSGITARGLQELRERLPRLHTVYMKSRDVG